MPQTRGPNRPPESPGPARVMVAVSVLGIVLALLRVPGWLQGPLSGSDLFGIAIGVGWVALLVVALRRLRRTG